jgi:hypothetical protein
MSTMVMTPALGQERRGGSAQLPSRSLTTHAPGLVSSSSHDDFAALLLQKQVASRDAAVTGDDLEDAFSISTTNSSFAELLTLEQQQDHAFDFDPTFIGGRELPKDASLTAVTKGTITEDDKIYSEFAKDVKYLEPLLTKFFRVSQHKREQNNNVAVSLLYLLQRKYKHYSKEEVAASIIKVRQQKRCCCVIM